MYKVGLVMIMFLAVMFVAGSASASYTAQPGDLLRTNDDATVVLVMDNGTRVPISADGFAVRYNNNFGLVKIVTADERGNYNSGALTINAFSSLAAGTVFMYESDLPGFYKVENGFKRLFSTWTGFESAGYKLDQVEWAGLFAQYPTGASVQ